MTDSLRWAEKNKVPPGTSTWGQSKPTANLFNAPPGTSVWVSKAVPNIPKKISNGLTPTTDLIKTATNSEFVETYLNTANAFNYTEESLTFFSLTGSELLQVTRNYNLSSDSQYLNKNLIDIYDVVNSFSPVNIIKLQSTSNDYFGKYIYTLFNNSVSINNATGIATISIPQTNTQKEYKIEIQTLSPKSIENGTIYS